MHSKVQIVPDTSGNIISLLPGYQDIYQIIIQQHKCIFTQNGAIKREVVRTVIIGTYKDLEAIYSNNYELDGIIVIKDSITPYSNNFEENLRRDPDTGVILKYNNKPIYRKYFYSTNKNTKDEIIEYNNTDEIMNVKNSSIFIDKN